MLVIKEKNNKQVSVGDLEYGTPVSVSDQNNAVYVKIKKTCLGAGLDLTFPRGSSVLVNIRSGTLRAVDGGRKVSVLEGELDVWESDCPSKHKK